MAQFTEESPLNTERLGSNPVIVYVIEYFVIANCAENNREGPWWWSTLLTLWFEFRFL